MPTSRAWRVAVALISGALAIGCGSAPAPAAIDLVAALPTAERRALHDPDAAIRADFVPVGTDHLEALITDAPARVIFPVRFVSRARFRARVALQPGSAGATVRAGIADDRAYDELLRLPLVPASGAAIAWQPIDIDLDAYSGWKFSLFYQPGRRNWKLVLNADATPGGTVVWLQPTIDMRQD
ncbi:MAG TPA: hypothetical protein VLT86_13685 [Vicinamibacterales bacterium]|nr:hypothetical protein [Vicinamibacterales bacterium]